MAKAAQKAQTEPEVPEDENELSEAIGAEAGKQKLKIQGDIFTIDSPYAEGYQLKANEAAAMNQLLAENIRNNMATTVRNAKLKAHGWSDERIKNAKTEETGPLIEVIKLSDEQKAEVQAQIDEYVASYEFGIRSGRTKDPFEREVEAVGKAILDDALRNAGKSPSKVYKDQRQTYDNLLLRIITENREEIERRAKAIMEQRAGLSINLGDVSEMPENGEAEEGDEEENTEEAGQ